MPRDYSTKWYREKYAKRKQMAYEYLGGVCVVCGTMERLNIDHVDPKTKLFTVTEVLHGYSWERIVKELDKCQLICEDHHNEKCFLDGSYGEPSVCGTTSEYSRGCRCNKCRKANRDYMREYRRVAKLA